MKIISNWNNYIWGECSTQSNNFENSTLEPDEFDDLKSLVYLDLDGNGIRVASADAFNGLIRLNQLFLSGNPLFPLNSIYRMLNHVD